MRYQEMRCALVVLTACSAPLARPAPTPAPIVVAVAAPAPARPVRLPVAAHGDAIILIALADDASAAASVDANGGLRLWPTLDGTREPLVVPAPRATQLALARDPAHNFALAVVDDAGVLDVVRIAADGHLLGAHQALADSPVLAVEPNADGFVALLADRTVIQLDLAGAVTARLVAPGRIDAVLARGGRTLALVEEPGGLVGRWIAHGAWTGAATPPLAINAAHAVLAPDGAHVAGRHGDGVSSIDVATGDATSLTPGPCEPLGFVDADTVACADETAIAWFAPTRRRGDVAVERNEVHAAADRLVVSGAGTSLALDAVGSRRFLGYDTVLPGQVREAPVGLEIGAREWFVLDDQLQVVRSLAASTLTEMPDVVALDAHLAFAVVNDPVSAKLRLLGGEAILDNVAGDKVAYEPATRLLAVARGDNVAFVHVTAHGVDAPVAFETGRDIIDRVFLLDPALAHGKVAVVVHGTKVYALGAAELGAGIATRPPDRLIADIDAVDRAGRVYAGRDPGAVTVEGVALAGSRGARSVAPNADGALVAVAGDGWLALYRADGTQVWRVTGDPLRPVWSRGELFAAANAAMVRFDLATGAFVVRRCGWQFGLFDDPPTSARESICDR